MPQVGIVFFRDARGRVPVLEWLRAHRFRGTSEYDRMVARIDHLRQFGHELRRPLSAPLGAGIHELRVRSGRVQWRLLYFFHGTNEVVLAVVCRKEARVGSTDLWTAIRARTAFEAAPEVHSHEEADVEGPHDA